MKSNKKLEEILADNKWVKNDIGMGRIQCGKLVKYCDDILLIIAPSIGNIPVRAKVKDTLLVNNDVVIFYDGERSEDLNINDFDEYRDFISEDEWSLIFDEGSEKKLEAMNLLSSEIRFYMDVYENIYNYDKYKNKRAALATSYI